MALIGFLMVVTRFLRSSIVSFVMMSSTGAFDVLSRSLLLSSYTRFRVEVVDDMNNGSEGEGGDGFGNEDSGIVSGDVVDGGGFSGSNVEGNDCSVGVNDVDAIGGGEVNDVTVCGGSKMRFCFRNFVVDGPLSVSLLLSSNSESDR